MDIHLSTSGCELIDASTKIEEETLPSYTPESYYPVEQGEIMNDRYQVVSKIGYGGSSTVWLARDLVPGRYPDRSLEQAAADIDGEDLEGFLRWLRRALQWDPRVCPTILDLFMDPWLMRGMKVRRDDPALKDYLDIVGVVEIVD
ncbi:hypothetical protein ASPACDRAFT_1857911 [Aspergillus aculeatus ATCC 16872]|uniref:Protein kinase domain-containing protein n=1 Tax=Aspergillus aculeatus (strain ATCC 16872 / CBS 172.66 / WB 5094) TaxID=690307 RepID=A0A1L9WP40_ASPA1|nr:uncharacterized protein ASPACDRAFT_1857911 [Aspergillus aculeatus ATCC 16872]OJJ97890.1 hypothetical protein ASPACDRAFT_1857911 [Aspergillus aculeatus ATCC 16872]